MRSGLRIVGVTGFGVGEVLAPHDDQTHDEQDAFHGFAFRWLLNGNVCSWHVVGNMQTGCQALEDSTPKAQPTIKAVPWGRGEPVGGGWVP